jgi:hypothetical protein
MAINFTCLKILRDILTICNIDNNKTLRVACLGYPDIIVSEDTIKSIFLKINFLPKRIDSDSIKRWHGIKDKFEIVDTDFFFKTLNLEAHYFDVRKIRENEIILNLNEELPKGLESAYDIVIDTGTLEHCFNVGTAFVSMLKLSKINGIVMTTSPLNKINHGFWNFSPCVYNNFFKENIWNLLFYLAIDGSNNIINVPDLNKKIDCPANSIQYVVAQRTVDSTFRFPIQQKYINSPLLLG